MNCNNCTTNCLDQESAKYSRGAKKKKKKLVDEKMFQAAKTSLLTANSLLR